MLPARHDRTIQEPYCITTLSVVEGERCMDSGTFCFVTGGSSVTLLTTVIGAGQKRHMMKFATTNFAGQQHGICWCGDTGTSDLKLTIVCRMHKDRLLLGN